VDSRWLADDGLPYSDLKMYTDKLIICKPDTIGDDSNPITVKYQCGQRGCNILWTVKASNSTTSNFRRHYKKFHLDKPFDSSIDPEVPLVLARRPRTTIADFWGSSGPIVLYKRGNAVAFDLVVFVKLLINFIISNLLALRIVESISFRQLLEYCLSDIKMPSCQSMMRTMLSFYTEA